MGKARIMMQYMRLLTVCVLSTMFLGAGPATTQSKEDAEWEASKAEMTSSCHLVILGTSKDFEALEKEAKALAKRAKVRYWRQWWTYDKKNNRLDGGPDYQYVQRRDKLGENGKPYISIEESRAYNGLKPGYFIIVADVCFDSADVRQSLRKHRRAVPTAYAHKTTVYMGCRS
jgi:hypothetical protein